MRKLTILFILVAAAATLAQEVPNKPQASINPSSSLLPNRRSYDAGTNMVLLSAEKTPEEFYSFRPTPTMATFAEILGAVADWNYRNCSAVLGEKNTYSKVQGVKTSKTELIVTLKNAFSYCDKAYDGMTEATAFQMATFSSPMGPLPMAKHQLLNVNIGLNSVHYGNLMVYMWIKNITPPNSDPSIWKKAVENLKSEVSQETPKTVTPPSDAKKAFEKLETLSGSWQGTIMNIPIAITIRAASSGTAILHEGNTAKGPPDHEITMFYVDGDRLLATHYCDAGNRSRMEGKMSPDGKSIEFSFLDVAGSTKGGLVKRMLFTLTDANRHGVEFTFIMPNGKPIELRGDFTRTK